MKKALIMTVLVLFPGLVSAQSIDLRSLEGEDWYGLYLGGHKSGYQVSSVRVEKDGTAVFTEDARFKVAMAGAPQDMRIFSKRVYGPDGGLRSIESQVDDPRATTKFACRVEGEQMVMVTVVGEETKETRLPRPQESLQDALRHVRLLHALSLIHI